MQKKAKESHLQDLLGSQTSNDIRDCLEGGVVGREESDRLSYWLGGTDGSKQGGGARKVLHHITPLRACLTTKKSRVKCYPNIPDW